MISDTERIIDEFLVLESQDGDTSSLALLIERWQGRFLRFATVVTGDPDLAADCVQDAWVRIIRALPGLRDPVTWEAWSHRIVSNACADKRRVQRRYEPLDPGHDAVDPRSDRTTRDDVAAILGRLGRRHRVVLALHYLQGFDVAEIADILGIPSGTVKSRLHHAREQFKRILETESGDSHERSRHQDPATAERVIGGLPAAR